MPQAAIFVDDTRQLAQIHARCFPEPWKENEFDSLLQVKGTFAAACLDEGEELAGFILWRTLFEQAEILTLAVSPDLRRKGIGKLLVGFACYQASLQGADSLHLEVAADNPAAIHLYDCSGFEVYGQRKDYYQRGSERVDAWLMRRYLSRVPALSG
jgi:ribosomal-protein-alanine N-acetyltransferase